MNQYRCETCQYRNTKTCPYWKWVLEGMFEYKKETIWLEASVATVGCASHSDFQSEQTKYEYDSESSTCRYCSAHKNEQKTRQSERDKVLDEICEWL